MNIVIPMAGAGSRFVKAGYKSPKPFIDVAGQPMVARVVNNLRYHQARYLLIARKEHLESEAQTVALIEKEYDVKFIAIDKQTEGTACTVLYAKAHIDNDEPLLIANADQLVDLDISLFINDCLGRGLDGSILTFIDKEKSPKWSFAKTDHFGLVQEVKEKEPISDIATVGIYLYSRGKDFVNYAIQMIIENDRINNEFYTCPTYNYAIKDNKRIGIYMIDFEQMHGLGTPEDLAAYLGRMA
ncbi:glycosyltransferase family 2 protein [Sporomusa acidovorans]|uniref:Nucleotidyl transferase domain-containing protein n=1 Tax=Sporomusa acidovorans (strain ATCC 49682 / DSM 3132 / Mol) TaxID=1123286 RepID=A0ABZ3J9E2_SPOA4|nr:glycosyltransferase family 2 protein [Sporomusa acidovorans]OZC15152.1 bifunctional protein GlmU [Sporomusa acidovorans DSM 3132]SDF43782.1 Nucleotidyl transferase [Sporomusa acidovorans]